MDLLANYGSDEDSDNEPLPHDKNDSIVVAQPCKRAKLDPGLLKDVHQPRLASVLPSAEALFAETAPGPLIAFNHAGQATAAQPTEQSTRSANGWNLPPEPPRIRIFPHVEGNFATVVYITVDKSTTAQLQEIIKTILASCFKPPPAAAAGAGAATSTAATSQASVRATAPGLQLWPIYAWSSAGAAQQTSSSSSGDNTSEQQLPLHMSISRTVPIKRIQIESLQAALAKQLKPFKAFKVQLQGLVCLVNDAKARSFVGMRVSSGEKQVVRLVEAVNRAFTTHGLQPFYEEPLPHVSLAWAPGDQAGRLQAWLDALPHDPIQLKVSQVVCQIGKVGHVVWQG